MVVFLESNIVILLDFFTLCCFENNFNHFWEAFHHVVHQGECGSPRGMCEMHVRSIVAFNVSIRWKKGIRVQ